MLYICIAIIIHYSSAIARDRHAFSGFLDKSHANIFFSDNSKYLSTLLDATINAASQSVKRQATQESCTRKYSQ